MTLAAMTLRCPSPETLRVIRSPDRKVTTPAKPAVWVSGLHVSVQGGWFGETWLSLKFLLLSFLTRCAIVQPASVKIMEV